MKSNRAIGNDFENELCDILFDEGFWVHNLKQNEAGQPADVIAVRNEKAHLIDCKHCSSKGFDTSRIESNQETAMQLWGECGNGDGWFALKIDDEIWMLSRSSIMELEGCPYRISFEKIYEIATPLAEWVNECE